MNTTTTITLLSCGLVSSLWVLPQEAIAQVNVTGGNFDANAGFFVPGTNPTGNIKLLDASLQRLRLESEIGNTSTAVFTPLAAQFTDGDGVVNAQDTGILQGNLTGLAFRNGFPVLFRDVATQLNFNVTSFTNANTLAGTLIGPTTAGAGPLIFLSGVSGVTLSGSTYGATAGDLQLGTLQGALTGGKIALSPNYQLIDGPAIVTTLPISSVDRRVKYQFVGRNITPGTNTDLDATDGEIRFVGAANQKFQIQTVGTPGSPEYKLQSNIGAIDITLGGATTTKDDSLNNTDPVNYRIEGESRGILSAFLFDGNTGLNFEGTSGRDTKFTFDQNGAQLNGRANGAVKFTAVAGLSDISALDYSNLNFIPLDDNSFCGACANSTNFVSFLSGESEGNNSIIQLILSAQGLELEALENFESATIQAFQGASGSDSEAYNFLVTQQDSDRPGDNLEITVVSVGLNRYYRVHPGRGRGRMRNPNLQPAQVVVLQEVGPSSSIFPGLTSLEVVELDQVPDAVFVGLTEIPAASDPSVDPDATNTDDGGVGETETNTDGGETTDSDR